MARVGLDIVDRCLWVYLADLSKDALRQGLFSRRPCLRNASLGVLASAVGGFLVQDVERNLLPLVVGGTSASSLDDWLRRQSDPAACARTLQACWHLLRKDADKAKVVWSYFLNRPPGEREDGDVGCAMYHVSHGEDDAQALAVTAACLAAFDAVVDHGSALDLLEWVRWFRPASLRWLRKICQRAAASGRPGQWLGALSWWLGDLEPSPGAPAAGSRLPLPGEIAVFRPGGASSREVAVRLKTAQAGSEGPEGAGASSISVWCNHSQWRHASAGPDLPPGAQAVLQQYAEDRLPRSDLLIAGEGLDHAYQWKGDAWVRLPKPAGPSGTCPSWTGRDGAWRWGGARATGASLRAECAKALCQAQLGSLPISLEDLVSLAAFTKPRVAAALAALAGLRAVPRRRATDKPFRAAWAMDGPFQAALINDLIQPTGQLRDLMKARFSPSSGATREVVQDMKAANDLADALR